mmetsp:Transcript_17683/g.21446  ORF Transcript_17683/g.21446 Transcript_17683/m.21446 type:complete len:557 (+) Transcript_17683:54-1724(+)
MSSKAMELSREEFISAVVCHLKENPGNSQTLLSPKECYREFCFDYPNVGQVEVDTLVDTVLSVIDRLQQPNAKVSECIPKWLVLSECFVNGVLESFLKFDRAEISSSGKLQLKESLSLLYGCVFLLLFDRSLASIETAARLCSISSDVPRAKIQGKVCGWLKAMSDKISYHYLTHLSDQKWKSHKITETLGMIIRRLNGLEKSILLTDGDDGSMVHEQILASSWPLFFFILRDRMAAKPEVIPTLLPVAQELISTVQCNINRESSSILLGSLSVILESPDIHSAKLESIEFLWNSTSELLPTFAENFGLIPARRASIQSSNQKHESGTENAIIQAEVKAFLGIFSFVANGIPRKPFSDGPACETLFKLGIIRTATSLWSSEISSSSHDSVGFFLLSCAFRSKAIASYVSRLKSFEHQLLCLVEKSQIAEEKLWKIVLSVHELNRSEETNTLICDLESFLSLATVSMYPSMRPWIDFLEFMSRPFVIRLLLTWPYLEKLVILLRKLKSSLSSATLKTETERAGAEDAMATKDRKQRVCLLLKRCLCSLSGTSINKFD